MTLEEQIRNQIIRASLSVVAKDKASTVAAIRDILILIEKEKGLAIEAKMSDLKTEVTKNWKNERNMAKGKYQLETVGEVYAWNYALDEVLQILK